MLRLIGKCQSNLIGLDYSKKGKLMKDYFDEFYDDYYSKEMPPSGDSCYCKTMMLCSVCAKGYN